MPVSSSKQSLIVIGFAVGLAGCGISRQIEQDEAARAAASAAPAATSAAAPAAALSAAPPASAAEIAATPSAGAPAAAPATAPAAASATAPAAGPSAAEIRAAPAAASEVAPLNLIAVVAVCRDGYPDQITQAVARAACIIKATEQIRPLLPLPDLLDRENGLRKSLAEQVQNGSISLLERNRQMTKLHASIVAEEQARLKEKPGPAGATSLAVTQWRLSNSDGCTSLGGNTANCY